eukprot:5567773-Pleurochrysis_carterae.AAC.1
MTIPEVRSASDKAAWRLPAGMSRLPGMVFGAGSMRTTPDHRLACYHLIDHGHGLAYAWLAAT